MAWTKASLRLVFGTGEYTETGMQKTKSKSFSNLKEGASEGAYKNVANAIQPLQKLELVGLNRVDYTEIEL